MKQLKIVSMLLLPLLGAQLCYGRNDAPVLKPYLDAITSLSHECSMAYTATCTYPDKKSSQITGRLAMSGRNYYDSSNVRFVFMNTKWLLMAEHQTQFLNIIYLPAWEKKMGREFQLDISGYLLGNASLDDFSDFKVIPGANDSFTVNVSYKSTANSGLQLSLHYHKGDLLPSSYEGAVSYALTDDDDPSADVSGGIVNVRFECHDIRHAADTRLFDDTRLVKVTAGKAQLRRYNHYKIYKKTS